MLTEVSHLRLLLQMEMEVSHCEPSAPESDEIGVKSVSQFKKTVMLQGFKILIKYKFIHLLNLFVSGACCQACSFRSRSSIQNS